MKVNDVFDAVVLKPGGDHLPGDRTAPGAHRRQQFLRQHDRRLVVRQQRAAAEDTGRRRQLRPGAAQHLFRPRGNLRHRQRIQHRPAQGGLRPDPGALGRRPPGRTSCCRSSAPPPCAIRLRLPLDRRADPVHHVDPWGCARRAGRASRGGRPAQPAARQLSPGRGGAGQIQLHARRLSAKAACRDLRGQPARRRRTGTRGRCRRPSRRQPGAPAQGAPDNPVHRHPRPRVNRVAYCFKGREGLRNPAIGRCSNDDRGSVRTKGNE